jgi:methionyl-tRNA synthetase
MSEDKFYVTTAIPYVNAAPHIGHALEFIQADVIARYQKLKGREVLTLTGADENSLKNVQAAEAQKMSVAEFCMRNAALFKTLADEIGLSYDVFFRSSLKEQHWPGVHMLWDLCNNAGDIYKKQYKGLYCVGCEIFYTENELDGGLCPIHKTKPDLVEEENYFFRLSKYQDRLTKLLESGEMVVYPEGRKNEMLSFIKSGLEDFSLSRSVKRAHGWGVEVPGDPSQIIYVWMDALSVYMTGVGYGTDMKKYEKWWPTDIHVIGKDIIRFHIIYWPAILMSAGLKLPKAVGVHGFLTVEGKKMSKTTGNVVNPLDLLKKYTADELRYYLMRDVPTFNDGDFSEAALKDRINKELAGDLGNLLNRVLTVVERSGMAEFSGENELETKLPRKKILDLMDSMELHQSLELIMTFVRDCNKYVNDKAPWKLQGEQLNSVLYNLLESLRVISILIYPFIPKSAEGIARQLGTQINDIGRAVFRKNFAEKTNKGKVLFEKR